MDDHEAKLALAKIGKARGWLKKGKTLYRFCGDGIYQTIWVGDRQYIEPTSPWYSSQHRSSEQIIIGVWSIFSRLRENWFDPASGKGLLTPPNFLLQRDRCFLGIQQHLEIMEQIGFDILDEMQTTEQMNVQMKKIHPVNSGFVTQMGIPAVMCHDVEYAEYIMGVFSAYHEFPQWLAWVNDGVPCSDALKYDMVGYADIKNGLEDSLFLKKQMRDYLTQNLKACEKYSLQMDPDFLKRVLSMVE